MLDLHSIHFGLQIDLTEESNSQNLGSNQDCSTNCNIQQVILFTKYNFNHFLSNFTAGYIRLLSFGNVEVYIFIHLL